MPLQTYNLTGLMAAVTHALGRSPDTSTSAADIVNDALNYLTTSHPWRWRKQNFSLSFVGKTVTSLTRASNVVTASSTAHGFVAGDWFKMTGVATSGYNGDFQVITAAANTFTYSSTGGDGTDASGSTAFSSKVALPTDFIQLIALHAPGGTIRECRPTSPEELSWMRQAFISCTDITIYYCVSISPQTSVTTLPTWQIDFYPPPFSAQAGSMQGTYLRAIPALSTGTDMPDIPAYLHPLLKTLCRAFAISDEEQQAGADWQRYNAQLRDFQAADGGQNVSVGRMRGAVDQNISYQRFSNSGTITY